jgi:hypothetical protein
VGDEGVQEEGCLGLCCDLGDALELGVGGGEDGLDCTSTYVENSRISSLATARDGVRARVPLK